MNGMKAPSGVAVVEMPDTGTPSPWYREGWQNLRGRQPFKDGGARCQTETGSEGSSSMHVISWRGPHDSNGQILVNGLVS